MISNGLEFKREEIIEILEDKLTEANYILKSNIIHTSIFLTLSLIFLYISPFYSQIVALQLVAVLSGISFLLGAIIFFTKCIKDYDLSQVILKLLTDIHKEDSTFYYQIKELFIDRIISDKTKLYAITKQELSYQIACCYLPEYILEKEIHVLLVNSKIIDFFYF